MNRFARALVVAAPLVGSSLLGARPADACGGCFVPVTQSTVVSGHRMALSISPAQTVLWDQIQYQGNPEDFSWVLPIKPGARVQQAHPAWFEVLESTTATVIRIPSLNCPQSSGSGCGCVVETSSGGVGSGGGDDGVTVVHEETVGPYDSVTLSSQEAGALTSWLESHGYDIPLDVEPVIAAYVEEGFDFIALRLTPGNGVDLMTPVRVITPGASPILPLRMVAAGTGARTSVVLYLISEGRLTTDNFPEVELPLHDLTWDGDAYESNYAELRQRTFELHAGRAWISTFADGNGLFGYLDNSGPIADTYLQQIDDSGGSSEDYDACQQAMSEALSKKGVVVEPCDPETMVCGEVTGDDLDARAFACADLTDLSTALVGMHPHDVWVTRLEAELWREALAQDLVLRAHEQQKSVSNYLVPRKSVNWECAAAPVTEISSKGGKGGPSNGPALALVMLGALAAMLAARRRVVRA